MPRHSTMWLAAGGSALLSAGLTYAVTRPAFAASADRLRDGGAWLSRKVAGLTGRRNRDGQQAGMAGPRSFAGGEEPTRNGAFEAYRETTLARLAEDERAFLEFLDQLRYAKDRAAFDQFMDDRRNRRTATSEPRNPTVQPT